MQIKLFSRSTFILFFTLCLVGCGERMKPHKMRSYQRYVEYNFPFIIQMRTRFVRLNLVGRCKIEPNWTTIEMSFCVAKAEEVHFVLYNGKNVHQFSSSFSSVSSLLSSFSFCLCNYFAHRTLFSQRCRSFSVVFFFVGRSFRLCMT